MGARQRQRQAKVGGVGKAVSNLEKGSRFVPSPDVVWHKGRNLVQNQPLDVQDFLLRKLNNDVLNNVNEFLNTPRNQTEVDRFFVTTGGYRFDDYDNFVVSFGKHTGKPLREIPSPYLRWLCRNNTGLTNRSHGFFSPPSRFLKEYVKTRRVLSILT